MAERLADAVLTTAPGSYPRASRKVRRIGQGIDTATFPYAMPQGGQVSTWSSDKRFPINIEALSRMREHGVPGTLRIVGPATRRERRSVAQAMGPESIGHSSADATPPACRGPTASWASTGSGPPRLPTLPVGDPMRHRPQRWGAPAHEAPAAGAADATCAWRQGSAQQARRATSAIAAAGP